MERLKENRRLAAIVGLVLLIVAATALFAGDSIVDAMGGDSEQPITGEALERASEAALQHTGGGRVTDSEVGDEEGYYEVEVTLDDGTEVDVHLDADFNVLGDEREDDEDDEDEAQD